MKKQSGFTLIELVAVMVILAILAVTAIPQFVDLRDDARQAATDGVAGALSSGATLNYAKSVVGTASAVSVTDCTNVASTLQGGLPSGYTITSAAVTPAGTTVSCTLTGPGSKTSTFTAIGT